MQLQCMSMDQHKKGSATFLTQQQQIIYLTEHGILTSMNITSTLHRNIVALLASAINIMQEHINNATMQAFNQLDGMEHA